MSKKLFLSESFLIIRRYFSATKIGLENELQKAKPFSSVPKISKLQLITRSSPGGKYFNKSMSDLHKIIRDEYGNIVIIPGVFGRPDMVLTYDANDFEKVFRVEGVWPERYNLETMVHYRSKRTDIYNEYQGLFSSQGEDWHKMRSIANPILMQPKVVKLYCQQVDEIAKEFIQIMNNLRDANSEMPADFGWLVNLWTLESVVAIALETRLHIVDGSSKDEKAQELLKNIKFFFEKSFDYDGLPSIWKFYETKEFKEFFKTYDAITDIILHYTEKAIENLESNPSDEEREDSILRKLVKVDKKAAIVAISDLLFAGVDTTATALINIMYCLAKNPEKQEILRKEMFQTLPEKSTPLTVENMRNLPYLRATVKESLRLFPVIVGSNRKVTKDVVLSGYEIPAETRVAMAPIFELKNPNQYYEADKFIPERWLRESTEEKYPNAKQPNPFILIPFSFGSRMCVGKRLADLEMETFIANVIRNYKLEWNYPDMKIKSTFVNIPISELKFKVTDVPY